MIFVTLQKFYRTPWSHPRHSLDTETLLTLTTDISAQTLAKISLQNTKY